MSPELLYKRQYGTDDELVTVTDCACDLLCWDLLQAVQTMSAGCQAASPIGAGFQHVLLPVMQDTRVHVP